MSLFQDHEIRSNLLKDLDEAIKMKKQRGQQLAGLECQYRIELTKSMAEGMITGISELGIEKPIAATAVYDLCRGIPRIAKLRSNRDAMQVLMETVTERIYALKIRIRIVESDIKHTIERGVS